MSVIFPGNYVAHLNAYREQGVEALPGVEFYQARAALVLNPDNDNITTAGTLTTGTYSLKILSPDLRPDDKPRIDKPFVIPAGSIVYRTAISAPNVKGTSGDTIQINPLGANAPGNTGSEVTLTAGADGFFPAAGSVSTMLSVVDGTAVNVSADTAVQVTTSADLIAELNASAGADRKAPSAIIVEVCYYRAASAPDTDDLHIGYGIEAGQGT